MTALDSIQNTPIFCNSFRISMAGVYRDQLLNTTGRTQTGGVGMPGQSDACRQTVQIVYLTVI